MYVQVHSYLYRVYRYIRLIIPVHVPHECVLEFYYLLNYYQYTPRRQVHVMQSCTAVASFLFFNVVHVKVCTCCALHMHILLHTCVYMHIRVPIHMCTHTYIHIYVHITYINPTYRQKVCTYIHELKSEINLQLLDIELCVVSNLPQKFEDMLYLRSIHVCMYVYTHTFLYIHTFSSLCTHVGNEM